MTRPQFNTVTFEGTVYKIFPQSNKPDQDVNTRTWSIVLETQPTLDGPSLRIHFWTKQDKIPYLIAAGRIGRGFNLTVTGTITGITAGNSHNEMRDNINLSNVVIADQSIYFQSDTTYEKTEKDQFPKS